MANRVLIRAKEYHDSVRLMRVSEAVRREAGVTEAMVMMATNNNKKILKTSGLLTAEAENANPDDLVIALIAESDEAADAAVKAAEDALSQKQAAAASAHNPRTLDAAMRISPDAQIACISVPGRFAARETRHALELGLNVLLFSDNVPIKDERELKELAKSKNRLLMGPDCGTAIINGVGLGFANQVAKGKIGIVGASGTGIQEISSLIDTLGEGVSHAIGTGGRDLKEEIGGITMLEGLKLLAEDENTEVIAITSKPPHPAIADKVLAFCKSVNKPFIVNFLGDDRKGTDGNIQFAGSLAETALAAVRVINEKADLPALDAAAHQAFLDLKSKLQTTQRYVRGLYAGGTLCYEALLVLSQALGGVYSNLAHGEYEITDLLASTKNTVIDMGDDAYTEGRAHPMIDPTARNQRILKEAADPETALLLLDMVIGYGAHADPAASLAQTIAEARKIAANDGRTLPVIVTICGTKGDVQDYDAQIAQLEKADIQVVRSNAEAVALAAQFIGAL